MKGYIYKYTFSDGKIYVGQTRRPPDERHREHFDEKIGKANPKFWEAYQNFGMPKYEIIETVEKERVQDLVVALNEAETHYIQQYKASNPELGYNVRERAYVSIPRDQVLDAEFDRLWTALAEEWYPTLESIKIKCFETKEPLTEEELNFFSAEISAEDNLFASALVDFKFNIQNLESNSDETLFWLGEAIEYAEFTFCETNWEIIRSYIEQNKDQILKAHLPETFIVQIDNNGKIVREYATSAEVKEAMHRSDITNIFNALEGKQKHAYGYVWKYKKDLDKTSQSKNGNGQLSIDFDSTIEK